MASMIETRRRVMRDTPHTVSATPSSLVTFDTNMTGKLKDCKVHFSPVQEGEGDPSPDNVRPIGGWTGLTVNRCGKNFSDAATGVEILDKWVTSNSAKYKYFYRMPAEQSFVLSATWTKHWATDGGRRLYLDGISSSAMIRPTNSDGEPPIFKHTTNKPTADGILNMWHNRTSLINYSEYAESMINIQLELGTTPTDFEPYNGTTIPIDWTDSAGIIYGGYVDLVNGEVVQEWCKWIEDGSRNIPYWPWIFSEENNYKVAIFNRLPNPHANIAFTNPIPLSPKRIGYRNIYGTEFAINHGFSMYRDAGLSFAVSYPYNLIGNTQEEIRTYLAENPEEFVYYLLEPIRHTIDPITLKTLRGINNVWSDANGDIELTYWTH